MLVVDSDNVVQIYKKGEGHQNALTFLTKRYFIKDEAFPSFVVIPLPFPDKVRLERNNQLDKQQHTEVPHEIPDTLYIYLE
jgi:hypothetical protein